MNSEIKRIAKKIGLIDDGYFNHWEEKDILAEIAGRLGMQDYEYNDENNKELYNRLLQEEKMFDMENEVPDDELYETPQDVNNFTYNNEEKKDDENKDNKDDEVDDDDKDGKENKDDKEDKDGKEDKDKNDQDKKDDNAKDKNENEKDKDKDKDKGETTNDSSGNGYNPNLKVVPNNSNTKVDNENLNHNRKVENGKKAEDNATSSSKSNTKTGKNKKDNKTSNSSETESKKEKTTKKEGSTTDKPGILSKFFNAKDKVTNVKNSVTHPLQFFLNKLKNATLRFLLSNPFLLIGILVFLVLLILIFLSSIDTEGGEGGNSTGGTHCSYTLEGVTSSGTVQLDSIQVELINCDGTESDYSVLETIDFEKYVIGVAMGEIGPDAPDEAIKAQIIAARNFSLTRNSAMCPGNLDNCFYGYNAASNKIRMRACEADHVYWDYEKDIYREARGAISLYSPEINSGTIWKTALNEDKIAQILAIAEDVKGKVLLDDDGKVVYTSYNNKISNQFSSEANEGKTYAEILKDVYHASEFSSAQCTSGGAGNIDYGDYVLSSDGHQLLHQELASFLNSKGTSIEEFNNLIRTNVDQAGRGTRAGVVAAAVTLIAELGNNYGVKIPYFWGGGHADGPASGVLAKWGTTQCHTYANSQSYDYCGLDCSGFVMWALSNGGFSLAGYTAGGFKNMEGVEQVSLSNDPVLQPGDLIASSGHVILVVGIDESSGQYICAEATGNQEGVLFSRRPFNASGYYGLKLDKYYGE